MDDTGRIMDIIQDMDDTGRIMGIIQDMDDTGQILHIMGSLAWIPVNTKRGLPPSFP